MDSMTFMIEGQVNTKVTVTEVDGALLFQVEVLGDTGMIGDLRALYFDLKDDSLTSSLSITHDGNVTDWSFDANGVGTLGQDTNMNGEVLNEYGKFDAGVEFGTKGISGDDIQYAEFTLSSSDRPLTLDDINLQEFGLRLTSVGEEGGDRELSLKLGGIAEADPDAVDDDFLATDNNLILSGANLLLNDSDILAVSAVNGEAGNVDTTLSVTSEGGRVGQLTIEADGDLIFDPLDGFLDLAPGQTDTVTATYQGTDGDGFYDTASLTITIYGVDDWGGLPVLG